MWLHFDACQNKGTVYKIKNRYNIGRIFNTIFNCITGPTALPLTLVNVHMKCCVMW